MRVHVLIILLLLASLLPAQAPHEPWMTVETKHFRVHYPAGYGEWTLRLASRMEAIHAVVTAEVGFVPEGKADVLVMDPLAQSNGMALPLLKYPRMILWATPPESWSPIGHYRDWPELLFLHEDVHLVHLLRPSRGGWGRFVEWMLPVGAVGRKAPRWVSEGYATYLEGKLTGVGRPNGDFRAAVLRKWALEGKLPSYGQMSNDAESWMGMSMAYLMGSAYMEWLVQRTDEGAWKRLWARLTAKKDRAFDAAFEGVFGDNPAKLYDRFTADLTWRAKELERTMKPTLAEGELWQDTAWTTGEPALSPDGTKMAIVLRGKDEPSRLVVWDARPDPEAEMKWNEEIDKIRKNDPEDVPGLRSKPFPAKVLSRMPLSASREPSNPRWMPDGKSILFTSYEPDTDGFYSPDLFLWTPESGEVRRVTKGAHVKEADPFPDGKRAVAIQSQYGFTRIAIVDLDSGQLDFQTDPAIWKADYSQARISPDGMNVAYITHEAGRWWLRKEMIGIQNVATLFTIPGEIKKNIVPSFPAWSRTGKQLFVSVAEGGFTNIFVFDLESGALPQKITNTLGAAIAAEPTPDGRGLYFLSLEPDGLDVRFVAVGPGAPMVVNATAGTSLAPAVRPAPPQAMEFKEQEVGEPKPYGAGRQEFSFLFGGHWTSYTEAWEAGVRGGDVLGRWNYFLAGGAGRDGAPEGGTFALGWRGWPVVVTGHIYQVEQSPSEQKGWPSVGIPELQGAWDRERRGASAAAARDWAFRRGVASVEAGALWEEVERFGREDASDRRLAYLEVAGTRTRPFGSWEGLASLSARNEWGETEGFDGREGWTRGRVTAKAGLRKQESSLVIEYERRTLTGLPEPYGGIIEAMTLGGIKTTLLTAPAQFDAILDPALMNASLSGDRYEGWRAALSMGGLPLFFQRHRLWWDRGAKGDWLDLAGVEWDMTSGPMALVRLPGFKLSVGGAYIFDAPLEGKTRFWLGLAWRP
jgi:Tol biopolymer transport system component